MPKHIALNYELGFTNEPFHLVSEQTTDGDRIARQQQQTEKDKAHANNLQTTFADVRTYETKLPM